MTPEKIFELSSTVAMIGWLVLILASPFWFKAPRFIIGIAVALLAITYTWLILSTFKPSDMNSFGTLEGVMTLFTNKTMVTGGWVHYLAFDLFIGCWIVNNARKHGINHWITVPSLFFTFMLGPLGWLSYILLRTAVTKSYFAEN
ncbi:MAG: DUF4281 domain-containing protein [Chitinophagaceae bacterium]|nr:DUF4281 domain-containing protein [Chitinophagaceae bacterium]